jgi:F0F1-type ATP synthase alpha subunit
LQVNNKPVCLEEEIALFYAFKRRVLEVLPLVTLKRFIQGFYLYLTNDAPDLVNRMTEKRELTDDIKEDLDRCIAEYCRMLKTEEEKAATTT